MFYMHRLRNKIYIVLISLILAAFPLLTADRIPLITHLHWELFGALLKVEHSLRPLPVGIKDILLVVIDNETLQNMSGHWPYPRSDFAKVTTQLKKAEAKVIAFDFVFLGKSASNDQDYGSLKKALEYDNKIILATAINDSGLIDLSTASYSGSSIPSGIVTKFRDPDGVTRRNLTYLVNENAPNKGFLSWGMQILKAVKGVDLSTLASKGSFISFQNDSGEEWVVPVDPSTKSFLIHFRAHTVDFPRLSFYRVLKGDFDPGYVKNKIVLLGILSSVLQDLHHTSIGWLPGITLNANAFLTLYTHDFLKNTPKFAEQLTVIIGVIIAAFFMSSFETSVAFIMVALEILLFFTLSYILLLQGYIWNYFLFPLLVLVCPALSKKMCSISKSQV